MKMIASIVLLVESAEPDGVDCHEVIDELWNETIEEVAKAAADKLFEHQLAVFVTPVLSQILPITEGRAHEHFSDQVADERALFRYMRRRVKKDRARRVAGAVGDCA